MTYSFSRLTAASNCKHSWYRSYVLEEKGLDNAFAQGGTFGHELCEDVANGKITTEEAYNRFVSEWYNRVPLEYPKFPSGYDLKSHYYRKIQPFFKRKKYWSGRVIKVEEHVVCDLPDGNKFQGFIDLSTMGNNGGLNLVDWKISKRFDGEKLIEKQRQLYLYAFAYHQIHGEYPERLIFAFFQEPTNPIVITFNKYYMDEAVQWAMNQIKEIERMKAENDFEPEPFTLMNNDGTRDMFCAELCNHRDTCPYVEGRFFKE